MNDIDKNLQFYFDTTRKYPILTNLMHNIAIVRANREAFEWIKDPLEPETSKHVEFQEIENLDEITNDKRFKECKAVKLIDSFFPPSYITTIIQLLDMLGVKEFKAWCGSQCPLYFLTPNFKIYLSPLDREEIKQYFEEDSFLFEPVNPDIILMRCGEIKGKQYLKTDDKECICNVLKAWYQQINCFCCKYNTKMIVETAKDGDMDFDDLEEDSKQKLKIMVLCACGEGENFSKTPTRKEIQFGDNCSGIPHCYPEPKEFNGDDQE